jgi:hypothetical protein
VLLHILAEASEVSRFTAELDIVCIERSPPHLAKALVIVFPQHNSYDLIPAYEVCESTMLLKLQQIQMHGNTMDSNRVMFTLSRKLVSWCKSWIGDGYINAARTCAHTHTLGVRKTDRQTASTVTS